jgi:hypothetical protein
VISPDLKRRWEHAQLGRAESVLEGHSRACRGPDHPPLPFDLFPELPLFSLGDGFYLVDDRTVDYVALRALSHPEDPEKSLMSAAPQKSGGPPLPPGAGGGGSTNPPPPVPQEGPGLKLTRPVLQTNAVLLSLREADAARAYELFVKPGLETNATGSYVVGGAVGQTNFTTPCPSSTNAFYLAAHSLVVKSDGRVIAWGRNDNYGQTNVPPASPTPWPCPPAAARAWLRGSLRRCSIRWR